MYLKRLEMQGFKSFADKTVFEFSPGVSAIVGPNGSGKSNVVDAIRWVLGEQSAKTLRGGKMEDVIFSGSGSRKPVGMAKVTLVMDNRQGLFPVDYDEVAVSRTLYRSGESNYELNKRTVRLKDIQELFMDTGLGRDGFSVIGQGKIDEILSLHAQERRGLLEEAAGISKYKYRKREAERRLTATDEDLSRLDDLLFELEERLEPLRLQAEEVARYQAIEEKERALATAWLAAEWQRQKAEDEGARVRSDDSAKALETALAAHLAAAAKEESLSEALSEGQRTGAAEEARLMQALRRHEGIGKAISLMNERLRHAAERRADGAALLEQLAQRQSEAKAHLALEGERLAAERAQTEALRREAETAKSEANEAEAARRSDAQRIRDFAEEQFALLREQAKLRNRQGAAAQEESGLAERLRRMGETTLDVEWAAWQESHRALEAEAERQAEREAKLADRLASEKERLAHQESQLATLAEKVRGAEHSLLAKESRLAALAELEAGGDGYFAGVQAVLRAHRDGKLAGIHGAISQLLTMPAELTTAMDSALGGAAQHLVVSDEGAAKAAIAMLKAEKRGRATFLPLTTVSGRPSPARPEGDGVLGWAVDLVAFDERYRGVMQQLLGQILVVETLDQALALAKKEGFRRRYVTLEGDILAPGGAMTGGRHKKGSSVLARATETKRLEEELALGRTRLERGRALLAERQNDIATLQTAVETEEAALREATWTGQSLGLKLEGSVKEGERLERSRRAEGEEKAWLEKSLAEVRNALSEADTELARLGERLETVEQEKKTLESGLSAGDDRLGLLSDHHRELSLRLARAETRLAEGERALAQSQEAAARLAHELAAQKDQVAQDAAAEVFRKSAQERLERHAGAVFAAYSDAQTAREQNRQRLTELETALREAQGEERRTFQAKNEAEQAYDRAKLALERCSGRLEALAEEIDERFRCTAEDLIAAVDPEIDLRGAKERLAKYKRAMQAFGPLNFTAPEEYKEVGERTVFLRTQIDDANEAKRRLLRLIADMEKTMSERFRATYQRVNALFSEIFRKMFEGGDARLELSMPANMLETGVEIVAQPPGKRERTLTLLSGGERAMTAIALLFALLEVRPSPFVILDEIEAALDGANVERFAAFIENYAAHTQFVVISHRQGTMEAADVLYGITMDGGGVSQLVSVRMDDYMNEGE